VLDQVQADAVMLVPRKDVRVPQEGRVAGALETHHADQDPVYESAVPGKAPGLVLPLGRRHLRVVEVLGREEVPVPAGGGVDHIHGRVPVGRDERANRQLDHDGTVTRETRA